MRDALCLREPLDLLGWLIFLAAIVWLLTDAPRGYAIGICLLPPPVWRSMRHGMRPRK